MNVNQAKAEELVADGLVGIKPSASFLQISVASLYAHMGRGELPFVKLGKSRRIPKKALIEFAARNLVSPRD